MRIMGIKCHLCYTKLNLTPSYYFIVAGLIKGGGSQRGGFLARYNGALDFGAFFLFGEAKFVIFCRFNQNSALMPNQRARRKAVSAVMARLPLSIWVMLLAGTYRERANSAARMLSSFSSSASISPGGWVVVALQGLLNDNLRFRY